MDKKGGKGVLENNVKKSLIRSENVFVIAVILILSIAFLALVYPKELMNFTIKVTQFFYEVFGWFLLWIPLVALILGGFFAFSRFGNMCLGGEDSKVEHSTFSWMSMLFTAGIGVGVIFYGPIEGLWHYQSSPIGIGGNFDQEQAMMNALSTSLFVWGFPAWAIYMLGGLIVSYFAYLHHGYFSPHSCVEIALKKKSYSSCVAKMILYLTTISIALSVTASIAMAVGQISGGLSLIFGNIFETLGSKLWILIVLAFICIIVSILPISRGIKILGNLTMLISIGIIVFLFVVGPTHYYISLAINLIGRILTDTIPFSFELYLFKDLQWITWNVNSYIVWWITWMPFVSVFLAKISKGRTIREFVVCSTMIPTGFMVAWFSIFSGYGLLDKIQGSGKIAQIANSSDFEKTIYLILQDYPLGEWMSVIVVFLLVTFIVTTVAPIITSLEEMVVCNQRAKSKLRIIFWCIVIFLVSFAVVVSNRVEGIKAMGSLMGFPFVFLFCLMIASLVRQARRDKDREL